MSFYDFRSSWQMWVPAHASCCSAQPRPGQPVGPCLRNDPLVGVDSLKTVTAGPSWPARPGILAVPDTCAHINTPCEHDTSPRGGAYHGHLSSTSRGVRGTSEMQDEPLGDVEGERVSVDLQSKKKNKPTNKSTKEKKRSKKRPGQTPSRRWTPHERQHLEPMDRKIDTDTHRRHLCTQNSW